MGLLDSGSRFGCGGLVLGEGCRVGLSSREASWEGGGIRIGDSWGCDGEILW
jgi:hypothetical protein